ARSQRRPSRSANGYHPARSSGISTQERKTSSTRRNPAWVADWLVPPDDFPSGRFPRKLESKYANRFWSSDSVRRISVPGGNSESGPKSQRGARTGFTVRIDGSQPNSPI